MFDADTHVIARLCTINILVMHFNGMRFTTSTRRIKTNVDARGNVTLFDTTGDDVANTFDFENRRDWHSERFIQHAFGWFHHLLQCVHKRIAFNDFFLNLDSKSFVPRHIATRAHQIIAFEATNWDDRNPFRFVTNFGHDFVHLIFDFIESRFGVLHRCFVHFVDRYNELFNAQQMTQSKMLPSLPLDHCFFMITFGDRRLKCAFVCRHSEECDVRLRCSTDHIFNEVAMPWSVDDSVMIRRSEEFPSAALDSETTASLCS
mmetsp:Transcript_47029/g.78063  ORF Transcript_47029/g.78063 Transcript_47029/m.78063 type:complete len:261 (-) Transcript_47029:220-1002(-)